MVQQAVIDAPWVPGVREYLLANHSLKRFVLLTATPEMEMKQILAALELTRCFCEVHGAPKTKTEAIKEVLSRWQFSSDQAVMVGDSESDLHAAQTNQVAFLLRRTPLNNVLQQEYCGLSFDDLRNYQNN